MRHERLNGLAIRHGSPANTDVTERFETEMNVINPTGFSPHSLTVADVCRYARTPAPRSSPRAGLPVQNATTVSTEPIGQRIAGYREPVSR
ncbi:MULTISPECIES: hypothetical protein [unclassified Streptomyces]|uniref:hypothetical protein n=1 Tax=unclassified Streptomyces TaxID=2593676 RepID=UPI0033B20C0B